MGVGTSVTIGELVAGTSYDVQVAAINSAGTGAYTAAEKATTSAATLPGVPTALGVSALSQTELSVMWTAPVETGGVDLTGYSVQYRLTDADGDGEETTPGAWQNVTPAVVGTSVTIGELAAGTSYDVQVAAINSVGTGAFSATETATVSAATVPGVPTALVVGVVSQAELSVTWTAPVETGGVDLTGYSVQHRLTDASEDGQPATPGDWVNVTPAVAGTSVTIEQLAAGTSYDVQVAAINSVGTGDYVEAQAVTVTAEYEADWRALIALYGAAGGSAWSSETNVTVADDWSESTARVPTKAELDAWYGVTLTEGRVSQLYLANNNLVGTLPEAIGDLTGLSILYLWDNALAGPLPDGLMQLGNLSDFRINGNTRTLCLRQEADFEAWLDGVTTVVGPNCVVDEEWRALLAFYQGTDGGNWSSQTDGDGADDWSPSTNQIPTENEMEAWYGVRLVGGHVVELRLAGNGLVGSLPSDLQHLSELAILYVHNNGLTGTLPVQLSQLLELDNLWFGGSEQTVCAPLDADFQSWLLGVDTGDGDGDAAGVNGPDCPVDVSGVSVTVTSASILDITWDVPEETGRSTLTGYSVQVRLTDEDGGGPGTDPGDWEDAPHTGTSASAQVTQLSAATSYDVQVAAELNTGMGAYVSRTVVTSAATVPGAPTALGVGVASSTELSVMWTAPVETGGVDLTGYSVRYRLTDADGAGSGTDPGDWKDAAHVGVGTSVTIGELVAGTSYDVQVAAINGEGTGDYTEAATATVSAATLPGVPTALDVSALSQTELSVMWTAPVETGGVDLTGYSVQYRLTDADGDGEETTPGAWQNVTPAVVGTSVTIGELAAGTSYDVQVAAINSAGTGPYVSRTVVTSAATAPGAPTALVVGVVSQAELSVMWAAPVETGGVDLTGYSVQYRLTDTDGEGPPITPGAWQNVTPAVVGTSVTIGELAAGTSYDVQVAAINSVGTGDYVEAQAVTVTAEYEADWRALIALYGAAGGSAWSSETNLAEEDNWSVSTAHVPTEAELDAWYGVTLTDGRVSGLSLADNHLVGTLPEAIGDLTGLSILSLGNNALAGPLPDGLMQLGNLSDFHINGNARTLCLRQDADFEVWLDRVTTVEGPYCVFDAEWRALIAFYQATDGGNWSSQTDGDGADDWSPSTNQIPTEDELDAWHGVRLAQGHVVELRLEGNGLDGSLPSDLQNLKELVSLYVDNNGLTGTLPVQLSQLFELDNLWFGGSDQTVCAPLDAGFQSWLSGVDTGTGDGDAAGVNGPDCSVDVSGVSVTVTSASILDMTWNVPAQTGRSTLTGYSVQVRLTDADGGGPGTDPGDWEEAPHTGTSAQVTQLSAATSYDVQVAAVLNTGTGPYTAVQTATTSAATVPGVPTALGVGVASQTELSVTWTAPVETGGVDLTGYSVRYRLTDADGAGSGTDPGDWKDAAHVGVGTSVTIGELVAGTSYDVQVAAINGEGTGAFTAPQTATVSAATLPGVPTALGVSALSRAELLVMWTAPVETGGVDLTGYSVQYRLTDADGDGEETTPGAWQNVTPAVVGTSVTIGELAAGTSYDVQVAAVNSVGTGAFSATETATVSAATEPGVPTALGVSVVSQAELSVTWTAPVETGGVDLTGYSVQYRLTDADGDGEETTPGDWVNVTPAVAGTSVTIEQLAAGTSYDVQVAAINSVGTGDYVEAQAVTVTAEYEADWRALIALYGAAGGSAWDSETEIITAEDDWSVSATARVPTEAELDAWYGVTLTGGRVSGLSLAGNNLVGTLPEAIGDLTGLSILSLGNNALAGPLPDGLMQLGNLSDFRINGNTRTLCLRQEADFEAWLDGVTTVVGPNCVVDEEWRALLAFYQGTDGGNWSSQTDGDGADDWSPSTNQIPTENELEAWYGVRLAQGHVVELRLAGNGLVGSLPSDLQHLSELAILYVHNNGLTGTLPVQLSQLLELDNLWFGGSEQTVCAPLDADFQSWLSGVDTGDGDGDAAGVNGPDCSVEVSGVSVTVTSASILDMTWNVPAETGRSTLTGYSVQVRLTDEDGGGPGTDPGDWEDAPHTGTSASAQVTQLSAATSYDVQVAAELNTGTGPYTAAQTATTSAATLPGVPTALGVNVVSSTELSVMWTAPVETGGVDLTGYSVQYRLTDADGGGPETAPGDWEDAAHVGVGTSVTIGELVAGTSYDVQVAAINGEGTGAYTAPQTATVSAATLPGVPTALGVSALSQTELSVMWTAPVETGGVDLTGYSVQYRLTDADGDGEETTPGAWQNVTPAVVGTSVTIGELAAGTSYDVQVAAINSVGTGAFSATETATVSAATVPGVPTALVVGGGVAGGAFRDVDGAGGDGGC